MKIIGGNKIITRSIRLAFFILPVVYMSGILSTTIHEVLGHGLSAVLLGGQFSGFTVKWDAMGWAFADLPPGGTSAVYQILFWASGIIATTVCGLILWELVFLFRRRPDIQLALLIGAFALLIDGLDYVVWNAYYPSPPMGDVSKIILFYQVMGFPGFTVIRWILLITGALLFAGTVFYFCMSIFVRIEALVLNGGQYTGISRILALFIFLALPGAYEFLSFDWNQIAPGIGRVPNVASAMSIIAVAAVLFWYRPRLKNVNSFPLITWRHIVVSGTCLLVTIVALALWLNEGVRWEVSEKHRAPRIIGPIAINSSGDLLVCGVDKDGVRKYYIIPLTHDDFDPFPLEFPGSDKCWGVAWRPSVEHDELLFITAEEKKQIKRVRISGSNISEISSYPVDPNLLVIHPVWNPGGSIITFRISELLGGEYHGPYLGFSNDNGKTIH
ncbi:MAG: M50 family metallopeptidase, partial [Sedimentisphaerales bacterium]|nr:M50 family metallopeptidase [Sedimentisphaerales bacterium]